MACRPAVTFPCQSCAVSCIGISTDLLEYVTKGGIGIFFSLEVYTLSYLFLIQNIAMCTRLLCFNALHLLTHFYWHVIALTEQNL